MDIENTLILLFLSALPITFMYEVMVIYFSNV